MKVSLKNLLLTAVSQNKRIIVDALLYNQDGHIFAQKRSANRLKHPNCWDLIGGHLEPNESLVDALKREIVEEIGTEMFEIEELLDIVDYEAEANSLKPGEQVSERLFQFLVRLEGNPQIILEKDKVTEYRWFSMENVEITTENRTGEAENINYIKNAILKALDRLKEKSAW